MLLGGFMIVLGLIFIMTGQFFWMGMGLIGGAFFIFLIPKIAANIHSTGGAFIFLGLALLFLFCVLAFA